MTKLLSQTILDIDTKFGKKAKILFFKFILPVLFILALAEVIGIVYLNRNRSTGMAIQTAMDSIFNATNILAVLFIATMLLTLVIVYFWKDS